MIISNQHPLSNHNSSTSELFADGIPVLTHTGELVVFFPELETVAVTWTKQHRTVEMEPEDARTLWQTLIRQGGVAQPSYCEEFASFLSDEPCYSGLSDEEENDLCNEAMRDARDAPAIAAYMAAMHDEDTENFEDHADMLYAERYDSWVSEPLGMLPPLPIEEGDYNRPF
jgi:hypothetical protein